MPWLIALIVSLGWLYGSTAANLVREWATNADASYGLVLTAVAIAVTWRRRDAVVELARASRRVNPWSLLLFVAALAIYLAGQLAADVFLSRVSFVFVLAGAIAVCGGGATLRALAAPCVFLLLAIPLPALLVNSITLPLQLVASRIAEATLAAASIPVFRDGNLLTLPSSTLEVAEACSGLRSLVSLGAIAVMLAWMLKRGPAARVALVAATIPIAVVMNGLRIAATGMAVEQWGPSLGRGGWHELTGWITFVLSLGVLFGVKRAMAAGTPARQQGSTPTEREGLATA